MYWNLHFSFYYYKKKYVFHIAAMMFLNTIVFGVRGITPKTLIYTTFYSFSDQSNLLWISGGCHFAHFLEFCTLCELYTNWYCQQNGVHKHSSFIKLHKETVAFLWSLNFFLTDISALPTPTSASLRITRNKPLSDLCYFWGVYFCPLTIRSNYSSWKQRRETPIYFCVPPTFHVFVSTFPNGEQTPPPGLIVHIVIGDISINLVICSWVSFVLSFLHLFLL